MKKLLTLLGLSFCLLPSVFAQSSKYKRPAEPITANPYAVKLKKDTRFIFNLHAGYAIALGTTFKFYPDDISAVKVEMIGNNPPTKSITYKATEKGLGEGFRAGAGVSYIINDFINVGLDFDYFRSTISKTRDSSFHSTFTMNGGSGENFYNEHFTISYQAVLLTFTPNITFKAISRPKFYVYNKIGAVVIFRPNSKQTETTDAVYKSGWQGFFKDSSSNMNKTYDWGIRNPSVGFMGAIGAQFKVTESVRVFGEAQFSHIVFAVRNRILTEFRENGANKLGTLPLSAREVDFKSTYNQDEFNVNPNAPTQAVTQRIPISYVGFQLGVAYRF